MRKAINTLSYSLRTHPPQYILLALVVLVSASLFPMLNESHRVFAFLLVFVWTVLAIIALAMLARPDILKSTAIEHFGLESESDADYEAFYGFFIDQIAKAKNNIYITGEGFSCKGKKGIDLAERFITAIRRVLEDRDVHVVRIETGTRSPREWVDLLAQLVEEHSSHFTLYVLRGNVRQLVSMCVIDPDDLEGHIVELMIPGQRRVGGELYAPAGVGMFLFGKRELAQCVSDRILQLSDARYSVRATCAEQVRELLLERKYYFAYGTNMSRAQMAERCVSAQFKCVGVLREHRVVFNRIGSYRSGGVASVVPCDGERVYGVIWEIPSAEFANLDEIEDCPNAYIRAEKSFNDLEGRQYLGEVYVAKGEGEFRPDRGYLQEVIDASREAGLPGDYIKRMEKCRDDDSVSIG